jgi:hypothetical protein
MLKRSIIGLAVAGLALTYAPAYADVPVTDGLICQFASVEDPTAEAGSQSGQVSGGPVLLTEQDGTTPESGTLICRVQVNQGTHAGSGPDVRGHGTGVLTAGPGVINYTASVTDTVWLCSEFIDDSDGATYYYDDNTGDWSTDINVSCGIAVGGTGDPSDDPINLIPCPTFAQLPSPVAEALQAAWGDCAASGPQSVIAVAGIGSTTGVLVVPPLWRCSQPSGLVGAIGSVTCDVPAPLGTPLNTLHNCKEVFNASVAVPTDPTATTANGTINGTTDCGGLTSTTQATDNGAPIIHLHGTIGGPTSMPVTCSWNITNGGPAAWAVICGWNLPYPLI